MFPRRSACRLTGGRLHVLHVDPVAKLEWDAVNDGGLPAVWVAVRDGKLVPEVARHDWRRERADWTVTTHLLVGLHIPCRVSLSVMYLPLSLVSIEAQLTASSWSRFDRLFLKRQTLILIRRLIRRIGARARPYPRPDFERSRRNQLCAGSRSATVRPDRQHTLVATIRPAVPAVHLRGARPIADRCTELVPETCDAKGAWQSGSACPYSCDGGRCTGMCAPASKRCVGVEEQVCTDSGTWSSGTVRANVCDAECTPGEKQCAATVEQVCSSRGQWDDRPITANVCDAECMPGSPFICEGTTKAECGSDGRYRRTQFAVPDCADCRPGQDRCDDARNMGQACNGGEWRDTGVSTRCGADCNPGEDGCDGAKFRKCLSNGTWDTGRYVRNECNLKCIPGEGGCGRTGGDECWGSACTMRAPPDSGDTLQAVRCDSTGTGPAPQEGEYCAPVCVDSHLHWRSFNRCKLQVRWNPDRTLQSLMTRGLLTAFSHGVRVTKRRADECCTRRLLS